MLTMYAKNLHILFCYMLLCINLSSASILLKCYDTGNFIPNSTYDNNRNRILSSLPHNASRNGGFYIATVGIGSERVYAIGFCRGDDTSQACSNCINLRVQKIKASCHNQREGLLWEGDVSCLVHYANRPLLGTMEIEPNQVVYNTMNISDTTSNVTQFYMTWERLMIVLSARASNGTSRLKFATGIANVGLPRIYALMQCTPDLIRKDCRECLRNTVDLYQSCCRGKQGGYVLTPNCYFRWELYSFFNSSADTQHLTLLSPSPPPHSGNNTRRRRKDNGGLDQFKAVVIIAVPIISFMAILLALSCIFLKTRVKITQESKNRSRTNGIESLLLEFDYNTIKESTDNFSEHNKLGQGGFGSVYKGRLCDGELIAVKRLLHNSVQGDSEFNNEVQLMAKLQHRNLVRLLGFSLEGNERLLIYEFVPNSSLNHFLFSPVRRSQLDWNTRQNIIIGISRGIVYLHEDSQYRIVHRDLKAANILLDEDMNPKIADFGMAKLFAVDQTHDATSKPVGTIGYMAPEYMSHGTFSVKSDVYSFGVLILEIIFGHKITCFTSDEGDNLLTHAWKCWKAGKIMDMIDPTLRNCSRTEIVRSVHLGLLCVQAIDADRPTMTTVLLIVSSYSICLPLPSRPALVDCIAGLHELSEHEASMSDLYAR